MLDSAEESSRVARGSGSIQRRAGGWFGLLVVLGLVAPGSLFAQDLAQYDYEDLEFRGIGAEGGMVWPVRVEATNYFGARVDLGFIGPRVRISPAARFWSSRLVDEEVDRLAEQIILVCERQGNQMCPEELDLGEVRLSDLELAADAHFLILPGSAVAPFVGGGLALHLLNGRGDIVDGTFVEDLLDTVTPGLSAVAGLDLRLVSSLNLVTEARFVLANDVRYASVGFGAVWTLPTPDAASTATLTTRPR
jgi:hypothetical protein